MLAVRILRASVVARRGHADDVLFLRLNTPQSDLSVVEGDLICSKA